MLGVEKTSAQHEFFLTPYDASEWDIFHIKITSWLFYLLYTLLTLSFLILLLLFTINTIYKCLMKEVVPKLRQEVKVKDDIVTSNDIKIYYTRKFQGFTAWYIINLPFLKHVSHNDN